MRVTVSNSDGTLEQLPTTPVLVEIKVSDNSQYSCYITGIALGVNYAAGRVYILPLQIVGTIDILKYTVNLYSSVTLPFSIIKYLPPNQTVTLSN